MKFGFEASPAVKEIPPDRRPIGIRTIGADDPRTLTHDGFEHHPELLFHGSAEPFTFRPDYDYGNSELRQETEGSTTLGVGFYTTPTRSEAADYSEVRASADASDRHVIAVLPYQAKVLDLRAAAHPEKNGDLPPEVVLAWREYVKLECAKREKAFADGKIESNYDAHLVEVWQKYISYLNRVIADADTHDIRTVLGSAKNTKLESPKYLTPPWDAAWSRFMEDQGFDGVIYNEGSEKRDGASVTTYCFYNLRHVGTYESWKQE